MKPEKATCIFADGTIRFTDYGGGTWLLWYEIDRFSQCKYLSAELANNGQGAQTLIYIEKTEEEYREHPARLAAALDEGERQREFDSLVAERDKYHTQSQDLEKKLAAIATLVSIYDNQGEPEGQVSARRALTAIGETIGQQCSICRSRHGSDVRHAAEW